jgi:multidrug transporter EmrE-like cation transporter
MQNEERKMTTSHLLIGGLVAANVVSTALSVVAFKQSGAASGLSGFVWYQIVGNLWGFASVLAFTFLTRYLPLKVAYPLTVGLAVLLVELAAAQIVFHETVTLIQAFGGFLIVTGIVLVAFP